MHQTCTSSGHELLWPGTCSETNAVDLSLQARFDRNPALRTISQFCLVRKESFGYALACARAARTRRKQRISDLRDDHHGKASAKFIRFEWHLSPGW